MKPLTLILAFTPLIVFSLLARLLPHGDIGVAGLAGYAAAERVGAVVDATHPFAETISAHAVDACALAGLRAIRRGSD